MTNAELIEKIRSEIERNRQAIRVLNEHTAPEQMSKTCAIFQYSDSILSELLSFLGTLESEKPGVDLEKEIERVLEDTSFRATIDSGGFTTTVLNYPKIARHFYELGLNGRNAR